ncbi:MAG: hypothetical protein WA047_02875 [Phenylobacterium sp.]|uniref:hypothetical protein n=1 Tax=Phenylobacterium sp. TaxID=1871053 RepID=UPI003BB59A20
MIDTPPPGHNRPFPYSKLEAFLARPGMDDAIRRSVLGAVAYYDAAPTLHRDVKDVSRFLLGVLALYLDASGGLTHRRLRELSGKSGILSAGTATAVLLRLQMIGYVTRADAANGHSRPYKPTPAMEAAFRGRMRIEFEALAHVTDEVDQMLARFDEPEVFAMLMTMMGDQSMQAAGSPNPDIEAFNKLAVRSAGLLILFDLMHQADTGGAFPPVGEVQVSVAAIARHYDVSRSHVLSVLRDIERAGWIDKRPGDGVWVLTPALRDDIRTFYGITYLGLIRASEMAFEALEARKAG